MFIFRPRMVEDEQQFCLKWNNYSSNMTTVFKEMLENEQLCDVTLTAQVDIYLSISLSISMYQPIYLCVLTYLSLTTVFKEILENQQLCYVTLTAQVDISLSI